MNIKTRILVFVILFEILAYSTLQLFNTLIYKESLDEFKQNEIQAVFNGTISRINHLTEQMQGHAIDLALSGEQLYFLRHQKSTPMADIKELAQRTLQNKFTSFEQAMGGGLWYQPQVLDEQYRYFGPYVYKENKQLQFTWDLNTPQYDYFSQDWYQLAEQQGWGLNQSSYRPIFWTNPYYDDAGSFSLMMTIDAVMLDDNRSPIGMATLDWSLAELSEFLVSIKVTENAQSFLFHRDSELIIGFTDKPQTVQQLTDDFPWAATLVAQSRLSKVNSFGFEQLAIEDKYIFYQLSESGFIFGSLVPKNDLSKQVDKVSSWALITGSGIGLGFIILMIFILKALFSPFDQVLNIIKSSIRYGSNKQVNLLPVEYAKRNEFTPIITALNDVYLQVKSYVSEIEDANTKLMSSQQQVKQLNAVLERKVALRTAELETKTKEATLSLEQLKRTQQQLIENEKHASLGRLVAGVAHQINTPLGICVTAASVLESTSKTIHGKAAAGNMSREEFNQAYAHIIQSTELLSVNLHRATNLINNFKQVAVDNDTQENRWFNLGEYIDNILLSIHSRVDQTPHKVKCQYQQEIRFFASPSAFSQILGQLVENALVYAFDDSTPGEVNITVSKHDEQLQLIISDNGKGMPEDVRKQVFDPFFSTNNAQLSLGLGLHIVYNLVIHKLAGTIECQSQLGAGTTFIITIPINVVEQP
ncbi:ATP-binding protein [Pseudoalteromonas rhizosphaerae]|uniref:ATP-binding response regulator n=1 Tax=Pseudoalteromonas rhizosphaerae TaxID=2518973 RepID=UPI0012308FB2|nr:ATP-binding protein [Pseudoalteromonas rhizosphaerae]